MASTGRSPTPVQSGNFEDEVDFGGSEPSSPHSTEDDKSHNSTPTAQSCQGSTDKQAAAETSKPVAITWLVKPSRKLMLDWLSCWHLGIAAQFQSLTW